MFLPSMTKETPNMIYIFLQEGFLPLLNIRIVFLIDVDEIRQELVIRIHFRTQKHLSYFKQKVI